MKSLIITVLLSAIFSTGKAAVCDTVPVDKYLGNLKFKALVNHWNIQNEGLHSLYMVKGSVSLRAFFDTATVVSCQDSIVAVEIKKQLDAAKISYSTQNVKQGNFREYTFKYKKEWWPVIN
jgi:hypothetical protein